jgi:hypothetical protein
LACFQIHVRVFQKKMNVPKLEKYIDDDKFKFLVVESCQIKCYGFDLKNTDQRATTNQIIQDVNNFIFNGWKVARQIPKWIHGFDAFIKFMDDDLNHDSKSEYNSEEDVNDDDKKNVEYEIDDEEEVEEETGKDEEEIPDEEVEQKS